MDHNIRSKELHRSKRDFNPITKTHFFWSPKEFGAEYKRLLEAQIRWRNHNTRRRLEAFGCGIKWEFNDTSLVSFFTP
ncbi:hypothetical protein HanIR_Chr05g0223641 [Helianthus annuus]|nr:hypothetical protein HanIR_Chr05g0223641 [Helianthus annuus]